uniref:DAZ-associated protein 2 n=1 Tax=Toxocara canis TaxID=6265 RepID=A0A183TV13_TOXCA
LPSAAAVCPRTAPQYAPLPPQPQPPIVVQESMWCREQSILANSAQFAYPQPIYTGYGSSVTERNVILSDRDTRKTALPSTAAVSRRTAQYAPLPPPSQSPMVASESAWWPEQSIAANSAQLVQQHPVCTANRFAPDCGPSCMNIAAQVPLHLTARFAVRQQEVQGPGSWQSSQTVGHASGPAYSAKQFQYGKYPPLHAAPPQPMPSTVRPINSAYSSSGHMANSYQPGFTHALSLHAPFSLLPAVAHAADISSDYRLGAVVFSGEEKATQIIIFTTEYNPFLRVV